MTKGNLFVISGPSGSGKDTVLTKILKIMGADAFLSVSSVMGVYGQGFDTIKVKSTKEKR